MIISRKTTVIILLIIAILVSNCFDLIISYSYFLKDSTTFIKNEINNEAIQFFTQGEIPIIFILNILLHLLTIIILFCWFDHSKQITTQQNTNKPPLQTITLSKFLFIAAILLYCITRISAGLTWYDTPNYFFYETTLFLHPFVLILLLSSAAAMITTNIQITKIQKKANNY
jgi:hypothetical protein